MAATEHPGYILDEEGGKVLYFDAVLKVQHTIALKIEDDPDKVQDEAEYMTMDGVRKKKYVNNAMNEADELRFDVVMSNVHTQTGDLPGSTGDRALNAYTVLRELKTSRRKVKVITTYATYANMLIKSIQLQQDESNSFGWSASITFHEAMAKKIPSSTPQTKSAPDEKDPPSNLASFFGELISANGGTKLPASKKNAGQPVGGWLVYANVNKKQ